MRPPAGASLALAAVGGGRFSPRLDAGRSECDRLSRPAAGPHRPARRPRQPSARPAAPRLRTYRFLIFDIDDTLVDFRAAQAAAVGEMRARHYPDVDAQLYLETYDRVNGGLWAALNRGELGQQEIRSRRFNETARQLGLREPCWRSFGDEYEAALVRNSTLFPGVLETLAALAPRYRLGAATNGLASVQKPKARRTGLARLLDPYVISEEEGVAKPAAEIFRRCLARADAAAAETLMVGDSWESDGAGAANAGIDFCWLRRDGPPRPAHLPPPVREIAVIPELAAWL